MAVTLICPNLLCGKTMVTEDGNRGKVVLCVHCQKPLLVPLRHDQPADKSAPPATAEDARRRK